MECFIALGEKNVTGRLGKEEKRCFSAVSLEQLGFADFYYTDYAHCAHYTGLLILSFHARPILRTRE